MSRTLAFIAISLFVPVSGREPLTLLPLDDSVTAGGAPTSCYREFLAAALEKRGIRFIGPVKDKISAHAGFGGRSSAFLRKRIGAIYRDHPADIVLIHAGHNHFARNRPVPGIIDDTRSIPSGRGRRRRSPRKS